MSTTMRAEPAQAKEGAPTGMLRAASQGDLMAMLALSDWYVERGRPPGESDGQNPPDAGDAEVALGFLLLAHACERASLRLRQIDALLDWHGRPARQEPAPRSGQEASDAAVNRIQVFLSQLNLPVRVTHGEYDCSRYPTLNWVDSVIGVQLPWDGTDREPVASRLLGYLADAYPGRQFMVRSRRIQSNTLADEAAVLLDWY